MRVKRSLEFSNGPGQYLTAALVAGASAFVGAAAYVVGWVWAQKYGKPEEIEEEGAKDAESQDGGDEENKVNQIETREIRVHARHWTPELLTPVHWRE